MMKIAADDTIPEQAINSPTPSLSLFLALSLLRGLQVHLFTFRPPPLSILYTPNCLFTMADKKTSS